MIELILAFFLAFACPKNTDTTHHQGTIVTAQDDTGGEGGHIPPNPPRP